MILLFCVDKTFFIYYNFVIVYWVRFVFSIVSHIFISSSSSISMVPNKNLWLDRMSMTQRSAVHLLKFKTQQNFTASAFKKCYSKWMDWVCTIRAFYHSEITWYLGAKITAHFSIFDQNEAEFLERKKKKLKKCSRDVVPTHHFIAVICPMRSGIWLPSQPSTAQHT